MASINRAASPYRVISAVSNCADLSLGRQRVGGFIFLTRYVGPFRAIVFFKFAVKGEICECFFRAVLERQVCK